MRLRGEVVFTLLLIPLILSPIVIHSSSTTPLYQREAKTILNAVMTGNNPENTSWYNLFDAKGVIIHEDMNNLWEKTLKKVADTHINDHYTYKPVVVSYKPMKEKMRKQGYLTGLLTHNTILYGGGEDIIYGPLYKGGTTLVYSWMWYRNIVLKNITVSVDNNKLYYPPRYTNEKFDLSPYVGEEANVMAYFDVSPVKLSLLVGYPTYYSSGFLSLECVVNCEVSGYQIPVDPTMKHMENFPTLDSDSAPPDGIGYSGFISTPFTNVSLFVWNPEEMFYVVRGEGIAWNLSCKNAVPTPDDRFVFDWLGSGELGIIHPVDLNYVNDYGVRLYLPAYYSGFIPWWCFVNRTRENRPAFVVPRDVFERVLHVPNPVAGDYVPDQSEIAVYDPVEKTLYVFKVFNSTNTPEEDVTGIIGKDSVVGYVFRLPIHKNSWYTVDVETHHVVLPPLKYLFFPSRDRIVLISGNGSIILYKGNITEDKLELLDEKRYTGVLITAEKVDDTILLLTSKMLINISVGDKLSMQDIWLNERPIDLSVSRNGIAILYPDKLEVREHDRAYSVPLNEEYKWVLYSDNGMIYLIKDGKITVYSIVPEVFEDKGDTIRITTEVKLNPIPEFTPTGETGNAPQTDPQKTTTLSTTSMSTTSTLTKNPTDMDLYQTETRREGITRGKLVSIIGVISLITIIMIIIKLTPTLIKIK